MKLTPQLTLKSRKRKSTRFKRKNKPCKSAAAVGRKIKTPQKDDDTLQADFKR